MKPEILLRINREGEFNTQEHQDTDSQCGKVGARSYKYFVSIEASNRKLTKEGFVMENLWVDEYFKKRYQEGDGKCPSCEDMAQEAISHFRNLFDTKEELKGVDLRRIFVRIHGSPVSFIEGEWKAEQITEDGMTIMRKFTVKNSVLDAVAMEVRQYPDSLNNKLLIYFKLNGEEYYGEHAIEQGLTKEGVVKEIFEFFQNRVAGILAEKFVETHLKAV